jgi:hypothetical protein
MIIIIADDVLKKAKIGPEGDNIKDCAGKIRFK